MIIKKTQGSNSNDLKEQFQSLIDSFEETHGFPFGAKECLRCIEIAKSQMESGKYSYESFIKAKELLINAIETKGVN